MTRFMPEYRHGMSAITPSLCLTSHFTSVHVSNFKCTYIQKLIRETVNTKYVIKEIKAKCKGRLSMVN